MDRELPWYLRNYWPYVILAGASILLYSITITYGFSPLDEYWLITKEKETLSSFSNLPLLFTESPTLGMYYRPMLTVSFMIDSVIGRGSTAAFHIDNIILHALSVLLLFQFLQRLQLSKQFSFFASLVFAVHPLHVHAVAWVPGRNDLLLASFLLLACIFLIDYLREGKTWKLAMHFLFFVLCLFTKESSILLPLIFGVISYIVRPEKIVRSISPMLIAWCVAVAGFYFIRASVVHFMPVIVEQPTGERIGNLFATFFVFTGKMFLPTQQSVMPVMANSNEWLFAGVVSAVIVTVFLTGVRDRRIALLGLMWFGVLIAIPVWLGMASGTGEAYEHRGYTPMIGLVIFLSQVKLNISERVMRIGVLMLVVVFIVKTAIRLPVYHDNRTYILAAVTEHPGYGQFQYLRGLDLEADGQFPEALVHFEKAIAIDSGNADYFLHRAYVYEQLSEHRNAIRDADRALAMDKFLYPAYLTRSKAYYAIGDYQKALTNLDSADWLGVELPIGYKDSVLTALNADLAKSR